MSSITGKHEGFTKYIFFNFVSWNVKNSYENYSKFQHCVRYFLDLLYDPKDGGSMFLWNNSKLLSGYIAYPRSIVTVVRTSNLAQLIVYLGKICGSYFVWCFSFCVHTLTVLHLSLLFRDTSTFVTRTTTWRLYAFPLWHVCGNIK
jgi:hypothetical protein